MTQTLLTCLWRHQLRHTTFAVARSIATVAPPYSKTIINRKKWLCINGKLLSLPATLWRPDHPVKGLLHGDHVSPSRHALRPGERDADAQRRDGREARAAEERRAGRRVGRHLRPGQEPGAVQPGRHGGGAAAGRAAHELRLFLIYQIHAFASVLLVTPAVQELM